MNIIAVIFVFVCERGREREGEREERDFYGNDGIRSHDYKGQE